VCVGHSRTTPRLHTHKMPGRLCENTSLNPKPLFKVSRCFTTRWCRRTPLQRFSR
jgi:hypothetical protein